MSPEHLCVPLLTAGSRESPPTHTHKMHIPEDWPHLASLPGASLCLTEKGSMPAELSVDSAPFGSVTSPTTDVWSPSSSDVRINHCGLLHRPRKRAGTWGPPGLGSLPSRHGQAEGPGTSQCIPQSPRLPSGGVGAAVSTWGQGEG